MTEHRVDQQARRRDGLHAAWEAFIVLLVCVNRADPVRQPVRAAAGEHGACQPVPQLHERYQQSIHVNFQYIDRLRRGLPSRRAARLDGRAVRAPLCALVLLPVRSLV